MLKAKNTEFNPKRLKAIGMRIKEPKTAALIFSSGKIVCTGAKSVEDSKLAARKYARIVQKLGFPVKFLGFKIQNVRARIVSGAGLQNDDPMHYYFGFSDWKGGTFWSKEERKRISSVPEYNIYPVLHEVKRTVRN